MMATVSLNPAVDRTVVVPGFAAGKMNRARVERIDPGGRGTNVAKTPRSLDGPGETRVNLKIEDPVRRRETELNDPGFAVTREHVEEMEQRVNEYTDRGDAVVFSGGLPPGAAIQALLSQVCIEELGEVRST